MPIKIEEKEVDNLKGLTVNELQPGRLYKRVESSNDYVYYRADQHSIKFENNYKLETGKPLIRIGCISGMVTILHIENDEKDRFVEANEYKLGLMKLDKKEGE